MLLFCLFLCSCTAPVMEEMVGPVPQSYDRRNAGIATKLEGEVAVLSIYVEDGSKLSRKTKKAYAAALLDAEEWLRLEANRYGVDVQFANYQYGYETSISYNPMGDWQDELPYNVIVATFGSDIEARQWMDKHPNCAVVIFTGSRKNYNCSAVSAQREYTDCAPYMEGAKIYPYEMGEKALEIAHEILHLFGAWDLYEGPVHYREGDYDLWYAHLQELRYANNKRSKSIMFDTYGSISKHHVDDMNAYLVGWGGEWNEWYDCYAN